MVAIGVAVVVVIELVVPMVQYQRWNYTIAAIESIAAIERACIERVAER